MHPFQCRRDARTVTNESTSNSARRTTRRRFLGAVGASAAAAGAKILFPEAVAEAEGGSGRNGGRDNAEERFTRMFNLRQFAEPSGRLQEVLLEIGQPGGLLDARDELNRGPSDLIAEPALSANNPNNPNHPAGLTFLGQFMDHDMTFDAASRLGRPTRLGAAGNVRTARFDLDSVYGDGPLEDPELYDRGDRVKFLVESGGLFEDVPRMADGTAIMADGRNDENLILSGLHAAFLLFHNRAVDFVRPNGTPDDDSAFAQARRLTTSTNG